VSRAERGLLAPPKHLRGEARRAWSVLAPKLFAAGLFLPIDSTMLELLCEEYALSRLAARRLQERPDARAWREIRDSARVTARQLAADFLVLPPERVHLVSVDVDGEDRELRALVTPGVALRVVQLTPAERASLEAWNDRARDVGVLPPRPTPPRGAA
jgi:hypothetical protein